MGIDVQLYSGAESNHWDRSPRRLEIALQLSFCFCAGSRGSWSSCTPALFWSVSLIGVGGVGMSLLRIDKAVVRQLVLPQIALTFVLAA